MKVHHIGYLVEDINAAVEKFISLGYKVISEEVYDVSRGGGILFLQNGETVIELIAPRKGEWKFKDLSKRIGVGPYHLCYIAENFDSDIEKLQAEGWTMVTQAEPAVAIENRRVQFFYNLDAGLIEILE